jgi:nucleolar pre-ribosomal-associated protein 2
MMDIMLLNETDINNPVVKSPETNAFAVQALLKIPLRLFSRKDRKRIRQGWLQTQARMSKRKSSKEDGASIPSYELTALNPAVLALKVKIMQLPTSYEVSTINDIPICNMLTNYQGMKFDDLVQLADALAHPRGTIAHLRVNIAEFKKFAELTLM